MPVNLVKWALSEVQEEILVATAFTETPSTEVMEDAIKLHEFVTTKGISLLETEVSYFYLLAQLPIQAFSFLIGVPFLPDAISIPFPVSFSQIPIVCQ